MRLICLPYNILNRFGVYFNPKFRIMTGYRRQSSIFITAGIIFLLAGLLTSTSANAQQISLSVKDASVEQVFKIIKEQTDYTFVYKEGLFAKAGKITINTSSNEIGKILNKVFDGKPYQYEIIDNVIAIKQKLPPAVKNQPSQKPVITEQDSLVHGQVKNSSNILLIGVTIANIPKGPRKKILTSTGTDGNFEINAQKGDKLIFSSIGYKDAEMKYTGQDFLKVIMQEDSVSLVSVTVVNRDVSRKKIPWTDTIDMTHRAHLNLGQLLQGTIPGLTLQNSTKTQQIVSGAKDATGQLSLQALNLRYSQYADYWRSIGVNNFNDFVEYWKKSGSNDVLSITYSTSVSNNLIPQLRGESNYNGNTSGMLIVIDGFPQDGFPADYPMTNIESVKVIKDPEELAKWGSKAVGGLILITSKRPSLGKLQIGYSTNFYYSPAPKFNRNELRLASSADKLSYLRDVTDSGFLSFLGLSTGSLAFGYNPAELLLADLYTERLTLNQFNTKWDSLGKISNEDQLKLLQQNSFNQNQLLTLSGGSKAWRFRATGNYNDSRGTPLGNYERTVGLNFNNDFLLLKNKLHVQWQIIVSNNNTRAGYGFDPISTTLQPYQLLLDRQSRYIYDYSALNPEANTFIESQGYKNFGENILEDARVNNSISKTVNTQSLFNMDWNLLPGLTWSTSFQYVFTNSNTNVLQDGASSQVRRLIDNYGAPVFNTDDIFDPNRYVTGVHFYLPEGGILQKSASRNRESNLRSALLFDKDFGKHHLSFTLGGGGFSNNFRAPAFSTMYGYNAQTGKGQQQVELPTPDPNGGIQNYTAIDLPYTLSTVSWPGQATVFPYLLLTSSAGDTTISRGLNWNANFKYAYNNTYILSGRYNAVMSPNYGYNPSYTSLVNFGGEATWRLSGNPSFRFPEWISNVAVSAGVDAIKIPNLPTQIGAFRELQTNWNNYGIWVNSYNSAQQAGQNASDIYEKLTIGMADDRYTVEVSYNHLRTDSTGTGALNDKTKNYVGANARVKLRKGLLYMGAGYGYSLDGQPQANIRAVYDIAKESYFKSSVISSLSADFTLQNISAFQGLALMAATNTPQAGGGFSQAINNSFGLLPPRTKNFEAHSGIGFLKDKYLFDIRYYRKNTGGLNNFVPLPTDPSTGLTTQVTYSEIVNKGVELFLRIKAVEKARFTYTITLNGAYNANIAKDVPPTAFSVTNAYASAYRNGYSTANLWSYRWAGLDEQGNPQIYNAQGQKTANPDSATLASSLVYSGVTRAPYTGGFIHEFIVNDFFARATAVFNLGGVMRQYIPAPSRDVDNSILIRDRWRKPGDEAFTDIAAIAQNSGAGSVRAFIIQNSTNSILPADNIRLQEVQIGWQAPAKMLQSFLIKQLTVSFQAQNLLVWKRNKLKVDPETLTNGGQIGLPLPRQYSLSINMGF